MVISAEFMITVILDDAFFLRPCNSLGIEYITSEISKSCLCLCCRRSYALPYVIQTLASRLSSLAAELSIVYQAVYILLHFNTFPLAQQEQIPFLYRLLSYLFESLRIYIKLLPVSAL